MELGLDVKNAAGVGTRCKNIMNFIRRALSFGAKDRRQKNSTEDLDISLDTVNHALSSSSASDGASTSFILVSHAPSVYEDPFVAVSADGFIHIKYYYAFNARIEFHMEDVHSPQMRRLNRVVDVRSITKVYYAGGEECQDPQIVKSWGMCRNDVWWASHLNRTEKGNRCYSIVLEDDSTIRAGLSVRNIEAFAESIQCVGLDKDCPFQHGLPSPPFNTLEIPFIDEDGEYTP